MTTLPPNDLSEQAGVDPSETTVIPHSTSIPNLRRPPPRRVSKRRDLFETCQSVPSDRASKTPTKRRLAGVFVRHDHGTMGFVDLYDIAAAEMRPMVETYADARCRALADEHGAPVTATQDERGFETITPERRDLCITDPEVQFLPLSWKSRRGIRLPRDGWDGARDAGAANGQDSIRGRRRAHLARDRGVTTGPSRRDPATFHFSLVERISPDGLPNEVVAPDQTWIARFPAVENGIDRSPARAVS